MWELTCGLQEAAASLCSPRRNQNEKNAHSIEQEAQYRKFTGTYGRDGAHHQDAKLIRQGRGDDDSREGPEERAAEALGKAFVVKKSDEPLHEPVCFQMMEFIVKDREAHDRENNVVREECAKARKRGGEERVHVWCDRGEDADAKGCGEAEGEEHASQKC